MPYRREARVPDSGSAEPGTGGPTMSYSLPLSSIADLAEQLRARSESEDEAEDLALVSGRDSCALFDDGDGSPTSSGLSPSSSSSSSEREGEWEDEWNSFQAAYADHALSFWNNDDPFYFVSSVPGDVGSTYDSGTPVVGPGTGPGYLNNAAFNTNAGVSLNTSPYAGSLYVDSADQNSDQEQAHVGTLWPTITPFPPRSTIQRQRRGRQLKEACDGGLQMRILAHWNQHQHNELLAARARAQKGKAARAEELKQRVMVVEYLHQDTKKTDGLHLGKPEDKTVGGYGTVIRETFEMIKHLSTAKRGMTDQAG
ncbi:hypothetical protein A1O7_02147 [Cladophialophora yegresii CBS 114405]|uniref:Uncharacterized protein n=1 Tax=Cladophialophora yegresii CBS 114405 TaxID=1182544 RepID=W9W181_9EURO|nr:uncharacterized protein A1O7_02147 [Cladophialophora yegresii CBS 114405]EXJ61718.1 hypothetical protein A1O7_02147 [Cladophialophora yegresii CBS 114405]